MIRTIILTAALLAAAGAAEAESIKVSLAGKTDAALKAELAKAAERVCADVVATEYGACVRETYRNALAQAAKIKALRTAALTF